MERYPIHLTRLVHENLSIVMSFAYSRSPLIELMQKNFVGEWKYLGKAIFEIGEEKANRAITELAILLRILDDEQKITDYDKQIGNPWSCGHITFENGEVKDMSPREFSNKIIHAKTFTWVYAVDKPPQLICYARDNDNRNWKSAEVNLVNLAAFCGRVMS
jgi:hypothetical protein